MKKQFAVAAAVAVLGSFAFAPQANAWSFSSIFSKASSAIDGGLKSLTGEDLEGSRLARTDDDRFQQTVYSDAFRELRDLLVHAADPGLRFPDHELTEGDLTHLGDPCHSFLVFPHTRSFD